DLLPLHSTDYRRLAIQDLEQATRLDPGNATYHLTLGRACQQAGYLRQARLNLEKAMRAPAAEPEALSGLGMMWRADWLKFLDDSSLVRAVVYLSAAARARPEREEAWLALVPLLVERRDLRSAAGAAARAEAAAPWSPEPLLAVGYTAWRLGDVRLADSAFAAAIPRLPRRVRERFLDISPVASAEGPSNLHPLPVKQQEEF